RAAVDVPTRRTGPKLARFRDLALIPFIVLLLLVGFIVSPNFLTVDNMTGVLQQCTELSLLVLGEAMILIAGRMDLSLESTIGVAPVLALWLIAPATGRFAGIDLLPSWTAVPMTLVIGAAIGLLNAFVILKVRINAFIWTLGMLIALRGLHLGITGGASIFEEVPNSMKYLGHSAWGGVPTSVWLCTVIFVVGIVALSWFRHG